MATPSPTTEVMRDLAGEAQRARTPAEEAEQEEEDNEAAEELDPEDSVLVVRVGEAQEST